MSFKPLKSTNMPVHLDTKCWSTGSCTLSSLSPLTLAGVSYKDNAQHSDCSQVNTNNVWNQKSTESYSCDLNRICDSSATEPFSNPLPCSSYVSFNNINNDKEKALFQNDANSGEKCVSSSFDGSSLYNHPQHPGNGISTLDVPICSTVNKDLGSNDEEERDNDEKPHSTGHFQVQNKMDNGYCQVCGDIAAGFYCGAFICEACKKFFIRASKHKKQKFVCLRQGTCSVTKETRVQCQRCRYQKCLSLQMFYPGEGKKSVSNVGISSIPCRVCGAPSSGFHFGALTCEGCKGFFRRMVKEREPCTYKCSALGTCEVSTQTRNMCKACRYKKCINVGMSLEGSRIGRQPNAIKHAISLEVKRKSEVVSYQVNESVESDMSPDIILETEPIPTSPVSVPSAERIEVKDESPLPFSLVDVQLSEIMEPVVTPKEEPEFGEIGYEELLTSIEIAAKELIHMSCKDRAKSDLFDDKMFDSVPNIWKRMMSHFDFHAQCIVRFAKKVPDFRKLVIDDQAILVQRATYQLVILNHSRSYELDTGFFNYFNFTRHEKEAISKITPEFIPLQDHFQHMGIMMQTMNLTEIEYALLSCMVLLNGDCPGLSCKDKVLQLQERVFDCFQMHEEKTFSDGASRFGEMFLRISELTLIGIQHDQLLANFLSVNPDLEIPQLFREMTPHVQPNV